MSKINGTSALPIAKQQAASLKEYSFGDMMTMGDVYFQSGLFKDIRSAAQAIVKIMKGRELGIPPASAMEIINVIEGKTALSGVAIAGIIKKSSRYRYDVVESTASGATVEFFERFEGSWKSLGRTSFTEQDAKRAGLVGKKNWREYPQNMYFWRALSNGGRMFCPDILAGVYLPEELGADLDDAGSFQPIETAQMVERVEIVDPEPSESVTEANIEQETVVVAVQDTLKPEVPQPLDPRPEWLRDAAQILRDHISQDEIMQLRQMWREPRYSRIDIVERMRTLAARYKVKLDLPDDDAE